MECVFTSEGKPSVISPSGMPISEPNRCSIVGARGTVTAVADRFCPGFLIAFVIQLVGPANLHSPTVRVSANAFGGESQRIRLRAN